MRSVLSDYFLVSCPVDGLSKETVGTSLETFELIFQEFARNCVFHFGASPGMLSPAGAIELGHRALHFFAGGVRSGADALDTELEVVWVGRADERFFVGDELAGVEVE